MNRSDNNRASRRRSEEGFTLIELLVAGALSIVVTAGAVLFLVSVIHRQPKISESAEVIGNARNAVEKITADLREGESATLLSTSELLVTTNCEDAGGSRGLCQVAYTCSQESGQTTYDCQRRLPGSPAVTVASGLISADVFCVAPTTAMEPTPIGEKEMKCGPEQGATPLYVGVTLELPDHQDATGKTVIEDGAALHNAPGLLGSE